MLVDIFLYLILFGIIIAFILGCIEAHMEQQKGNDISDFPAAIPIISLLNWIYVWYFVTQYILKKYDKE